LGYFKAIGKKGDRQKRRSAKKAIGQKINPIKPSQPTKKLNWKR